MTSTFFSTPTSSMASTSTSSAYPTGADGEPLPAWIVGYAPPLSPTGNLVIQIYFYGVLAAVLGIAFYITIYKTYIRGPKDKGESDSQDIEKNISDDPAEEEDEEEAHSTPNSPYERGAAWGSDSTVNNDLPPMAPAPGRTGAESVPN